MNARARKLAAYLSDCKEVSEEAMAAIQGVEVLIIDALRHTEHPTHLSVREALEISEQIAPGQTWFTHLCHDLGHAANGGRTPRRRAHCVRRTEDRIRMSPRLGRIPLGLAILLLFCDGVSQASGEDPLPASPSREANATLVVYNNLDPVSVSLAGYYARRRSIPLDHVIGLDCPQDEEISRADYDRSIAEPLRKIFALRGWWREPAEPDAPVRENQHPLHRAHSRDSAENFSGRRLPRRSLRRPPKELDVNAAAVDSELATLGTRTRQISGEIDNPYYRSFLPSWSARSRPSCCLPAGCAHRRDRAKDDRRRVGGGAARPGRLRLYRHAGVTEGAFTLGDKWLAAAAARLRESGMPVVWDS